MSNLHRKLAPISDDAWAQIEEEAGRTLKRYLGARRVVDVNGPLVVDDVDLLTRAALEGVGLAFMGDELARPHLESGALMRVLEDWCPPFPGYFLFYPSRRQQPRALTALIDTLRV